MAPREVILSNRHSDEMEEDVADAMQAWTGQLIHDAVEDDIPRAEVKVNGVLVSGTADTMPINGHVRDWKTTSVWNIIFKSGVKKWEQQLNLYAYIYGIAYGWDVTKLSVNAYIMDWQRSRAKFDRSYPSSRYQSIPIDLWTPEQQEEFITNQVDMMESANTLPDDELPYCSDEERWYGGTKFAITRQGNKKASKICDTLEEAQDWLGLKSDSNSFDIVKREGEHRKCQDYCSASPFCSQWKEICGE